MDSNLTDLQRANRRIATQKLQLQQQSRSLRQAERRASGLREEVDDLQHRIAELLAQKREPQCLDDVIHPRQEPAKGGE